MYKRHDVKNFNSKALEMVREHKLKDIVKSCGQIKPWNMLNVIKLQISINKGESEPFLNNLLKSLKEEKNKIILDNSLKLEHLENFKKELCEKIDLFKTNESTSLIEENINYKLQSIPEEIKSISEPADVVPTDVAVPTDAVPTSTVEETQISEIKSISESDKDDKNVNDVNDETIDVSKEEIKEEVDKSNKNSICVIV